MHSHGTQQAGSTKWLSILLKKNFVQMSVSIHGLGMEVLGNFGHG